MSWEQHEHDSILQRIWKLFSYNFGLKALSIAFAVILFLSVRTEQVREYNRSARIRIITNERMMVIGAQERAVDVTLKLPNSLFIHQPEERELVGELDVRNQNPGRVRVRLSAENFPRLDKDKRYTLTIHEPWIEVDLDWIQTKELEIRVPIEGRPREGFAVDRIIVNPERVEGVGAKREMSKLSMITTSVINIEGIDKSFSSRTKIVVDENSSVRLKDEWVNVQVVVTQQRAVRVFRSIPVETGAGARVQVKPSSIEVELSGDRANLDGLQLGDVRVFLDTKRLSPGWQDRAVKLQLPRGTSLVRISPSSVAVRPQN
jgi:YbbR domain-containing protein